MVKELYAHVDCNNFFVSCERVFQPELNNKPVIVLSNNDGCVVARSWEVREMGIPLSIPYFKIEKFVLKHGIHVFSSNYTLYADISDRVFKVLSEFSEDILKYSIDESFLKFRFSFMYQAEDTAENIVKRVLKYTGIPVCVGIAPTKTLAKLCTLRAKKLAEKKFHIYSDEKNTDILADTPVEKIWGIGRRYGDHLKKNGVETAKDLRDSDELWIDSVFGISVLRTVRELKCDSCIDIENMDSKKSILRSGSFGKTITEFEILNQALSSFVLRAVQNLRKRNLLTKILTVYIMTSKYSDKKYYSSVPLVLFTPSDSISELLGYSRKALEKIYKPGYDYRRAGVSLECLVKKESYQSSFFGDYSRDRKNRLMEIMDLLNAGIRKNVIYPAAVGDFRNSEDRKTRLSKKYTTDWHEIPTAKNRL